MKNKTLKKTLLISTGLLAAGGICIGIGIAMGGSPVFYLDNEGIHLKETTACPETVQDYAGQKQLAAFEKIEVDLKYGEFSLEEGDSYSVLIRAKDNDNKNIFVAVHLNQDNPSQQDRDKGILIVDDIKSFHGREMENIISPIVENKSLVWVNKKDSLELLSSAKSTPQYNDIQDYLSDAVNIVRKFENTNEKDNELNIIKGKIEDEQLLNQIVAEIIEKAKKGSPIGTEKTWGGKVYVKTELVG